MFKAVRRRILGAAADAVLVGRDGVLEEQEAGAAGVLITQSQQQHVAVGTVPLTPDAGGEFEPAAARRLDERGGRGRGGVRLLQFFHALLTPDYAADFPGTRGDAIDAAHAELA